MTLFARTPELIGSMSGFAPGVQTTINIPRSHTYYTLAIHMVIDGVTLTDANIDTYVEKISIRANAEPRYELKGEEVENYFAQRDITMKKNFIPIQLAQPHMRTAAGEDVSGYGTLDLRSFELFVDLKPGNYTINKMDLYAIRGENQPLGPHYRLTTYRRSSNGAGELELNSFTRAQQRIMGIFMDTDQIDGVTLKANDVIIHSSKSDVREGFLGLANRTQNGKCMIDLVTSNRLEDGFEVAGRDVRMTCDMASATSFNMLVESIETLAG